MRRHSGHPRERSVPRQENPSGYVVSDHVASAIAAGHPWVYREALGTLSTSLAPGDVIELQNEAGAFLARAAVDPTSPLAARILTREASEPVDEAFFARRLDAAFALRDTLVARPDTTAYRLCHGEGDGVPGVVIDRYNHVAVVRTDGAAAAAWLSENGGLRSVLTQRLAAVGVTSAVLRDGSRGGDRTVTVLAGEAPPDTLLIREHDLRMEVDLARGQKTGAFLDQRENRRRVRSLAAGRRVLNLFSYAGGFSLAAAAGGAAYVTSVDIAASGHATAQRSWRANDLDPARATFVTADAFTFLDGAAARGDTWDFIISDPPSFAPSEKTKPRALAAYRKLHSACVRLLAPGGLFGASSCSSHVDTEAFLGTLGGLSLQLVDLFGPPPDHPTLPAWREGRYLKFALLTRA